VTGITRLLNKGEKLPIERGTLAELFEIGLSIV